MFGAGERRMLSCPVPVVGRYVYISLRTQDWLTLCEVEVYSPDPGNLGKYSIVYFYDFIVLNQ